MTIAVQPAQVATLSAKARDFLKAAPMLRLPGFMWSYLLRPAAIAKQRAQFQAGEDMIEEALIASGGLALEKVMIGGVPVLKITPPNIDSALDGSIVLNIHGGGFGWDAAGVVEAMGGEVSLFAVGDEVYYAGDLKRPGSNAELQAVDERIVGHKPKSLNWAEAAALPLTTITAWELLFDRLCVPCGEKGTGALLVINGAGGVGSILIQLARQLTGLTVIATASRPETVEWVRKMGAHHVIDHHRPLDEELARIGIPEVDYVAGLTASDRYWPMFPKIVAPQGHIALIDDPETFDITPLKRKAITVSWEFMFTRSMFETPDMIEQHRLLEEVSRLVDDGILPSTLTETLSPISADTLKRAHKRVESGASIGKTVVEGF